MVYLLMMSWRICHTILFIGRNLGDVWKSMRPNWQTLTKTTVKSQKKLSTCCGIGNKEKGLMLHTKPFMMLYAIGLYLWQNRLKEFAVISEVSIWDKHSCDKGNSSVLRWASPSAHNIATWKGAVIFIVRLKRGNYGPFLVLMLFVAILTSLNTRLKRCLSWNFPQSPCAK